MVFVGVIYLFIYFGFGFWGFVFFFWHENRAVDGHFTQKEKLLSHMDLGEFILSGESELCFACVLKKADVGILDFGRKLLDTWN